MKPTNARLALPLACMLLAALLPPRLAEEEDGVRESGPVTSIAHRDDGGAYSFALSPVSTFDGRRGRHVFTATISADGTMSGTHHAFLALDDTSAVGNYLLDGDAVHYQPIEMTWGEVDDMDDLEIEFDRPFRWGK